MITSNDASVVREFEACRAALEQWMDDRPLIGEGRRIAQGAAEFVMGWMSNRVAVITQDNRRLAEADRKAEAFCKEMVIRCGDASTLLEALRNAVEAKRAEGAKP